MWFWSKKKKQKQQSATIPATTSAAKDLLDKEEILSALNQIQRELDRLKLAISDGQGVATAVVQEEGRLAADILAELKERRGTTLIKNDAEKIIEGVFDGEMMVGADGERYEVPANYASKSKLVEGDILKLTINNLGSFIYKQIKPIERLRRVGMLEQDPQNLQYYAVADGKKWKLLTASVTYFRGTEGEEVVFLIPSAGGSRYAAVENIIRNG